MSLSVIFVLTLLAIYSIAGVALNLLQGYAGQLSLALAANFSIGAYTFAIVSVELNWSTLPAILASAAVSCAIQVGLSLLTARLAELYFVLATLALQLVVLALIHSWTDLTGGPAGIFGLPLPSFAGIDLGEPTVFLAFAAFWLLLCLITTRAVAKSNFGLKLRALQDDVTALTSTGHDARWVRIGANAFYSAWFGVAGALYAALLNTVTPLSFGILLSVTFQSLIIIGGSGSFFGPLIGVAVLIGIPEGLRYVSGLGVSDVALAAGRDIMYGVLLILVMRFRPEGVLPMRPADAGPRWTTQPRPRKNDALLPSGPATAPGREADAGSHETFANSRDTTGEISGPPGAHPVLSMHDIRISFGGVKALDGASAEVLDGRVTGIIGPNGAGKSTLFNVATGYLKPDSGVVELRGQAITSLRPHVRVHKGIGRTFQNLRLFQTLTVTQNLALSCAGLPSDEARERVDTWLEYLRLNQHAERVTGELDYGTQKSVALARALCTGADTLLLDEPASGLDRQQVASLSKSLRDLVQDTGTTVCLVEHNMDLIRDVADDVYALHEGRTIASGNAESVLGDREVMRVYLGA